ncbi:MAG TPA: EAL domain-containing protein [Solirubrobacterales bacterium]|nr:EAL domain-containing protein [Solirubrobacterales bacterium]
MIRERAPAGAGDVVEPEIRSRLDSIAVGIWLTVVVSLGGGAYALHTWSGPHRNLILAATVLGLLSVPLLKALPGERIVRSRYSDLFFISWSLSDILLVGVIAALDGGSTSPYILLLVLPFLFAALSYTPRAIVVVGLAELAALSVLAFAVGGGLPLDGFGLFAMVCIGLLGTWEARNLARQRNALSETAVARARSEETSRRLARQQTAVAQFGQLALEGTDIDTLTDEATALMERILDIDIGGALKLLPGGDELLLISGVGLAAENVGQARVPTGHESQFGYALATGLPVVVGDWQTESRFRESKLQVDSEMRSAAAVLIKAKGDPYGVLGVGSRIPHRFTQDEVSFMQAIANVLANAIERRRNEERTQHEALHDPLTGLPNRNLFLDRLQHALSVAARRGTAVAVLFLDLDQFKLVNDSLGHAAGDELLAAVAPRIEQALRPGDTVARFGGDEFAVLAEDIGNERGATRIAERIAEVLSHPFILREREHFVSASVGIAIGEGQEPPEALIRDADSALYRAKEHGRGGYEIFDEVMRSRVIEHMQIENDLRRAIQRGELELHYQPVIKLGDGSIVALEGLLRWNHPDRGLVGPLGFIPVAEESRLILPIGRWVIEQACRQAAAWQQLHPDSAPISVAVNLSERQIADPDLISHIEGSVEANRIDPSSLWLELTETTLLDDTAFVERTLESLKGLGVRLVLDDFGVGFSSLGHLKRLPISMIKLDRSFVENLTEGSHDAAIVRAVNEMADTIGIGVIAEGVETDQQVRMARALGCGYAQGFHFSEPVPVSHVEDLLERPMPTFS